MNFVIENCGGLKTPINIEGEKGIVLGAVAVGESKGKTLGIEPSVGIGRVELAHHGSDARTPGVGRDASLPRPVHEIPDDQEVRRDQLVREDLELAFEPRPDLGRDPIGAVSPDEPRLAEIPQGTIASILELLLGDVASLPRFERLEFETVAVPLEPLGQVAAVVDRRFAGMHDLDDRRVSIWGMDRDLTAKAVDFFEQRYLDAFLEAATDPS